MISRNKVKIKNDYLTFNNKYYNSNFCFYIIDELNRYKKSISLFKPKNNNNFVNFRNEYTEKEKLFFEMDVYKNFPIYFKH